MTDNTDKGLREILNYCRIHYGSNGISDEYEEELLSRIARQVQAAKITALKPLANKTIPTGEDVHPEYTKGFTEMRGKVAFELNRLQKLQAAAPTTAEGE